MEVSAKMKYSVKGNKILGCKTGTIKQEKGDCQPLAPRKLLLGSLHVQGGVGRVLRRARG